MKWFSRLFDLARRVAAHFKQDRGLRTAGSLTYTTLLALVPLLVVALALMSAFPLFQGLAGVIEDFVFDNLLPESVALIQEYTAQFVDNAAQLTTVGLILLAVTAIMLLFTIDAAFNDIWRVRYPRPVMQRLLIYGALIIVGPLLIGVSLSLSSWLLSASAGWTHDIPYVQSVQIKVTAIALTSLALALLYYAMPNRRVRARDALVGGVLAAIVFEFTKQGFGFYITQIPTYTLIYGAFAAVPVFLLWLYISWVVVIAGAVLVATLPEWRQQSLQGHLAPGSDFVYALHVLKRLWLARQNGEAVRVSQVHGALNLSYERIEALLEVMERAAWVKRVASAGWVLQRDAAAIAIADVYRHFVFDAQSVVREDQTQTAGLAHALDERISVGAGQSLAEFFDAASVVKPAGTR